MRGGVARRCLWLLAAVGGAAAAAAPAEVAAQDLGTWTPGKPLPNARRLLAAATEGGRLFAFGGCGSPCFSPPLHVSTFEETRVEVFDPATDGWSARRPMPYVFFGGAAAAPGDGFVYTVGGVVSGGTAMRYDPDPAADAWSPRAPLPTPRHGLAAAALGGEVYAVGGTDGRAATGALEVYDPRLDRWRRVAPMPTPRAQLAAAALGGRLYAIGGSPDCCGGGASAAVEVYDPATDTWTAATPLPSPRQVQAAAAIGERLYVFGGFVPGAGVLAETLEYDPRLDRWRRLADLPALPGEATGGRDQAAVAVLGGLAHLVGGSVDCHCRALDGHVIFDPPPVDDPRLPPPADLSCALATPPTMRAGEPATLTLTVTNRGPGAAAGASVALRLAPRLLALGWSCAAASPGAVCPAAGAGDLAARVSLPAGGSLRFEVEATAAAAETCPLPVDGLTVEGRVFAPLGVADPRPGNDGCSAVVEYAPVVDLRLVQEARPPIALAGGAATFAVTVANSGPDAACAAVLSSIPSPALSPVSWACKAPGPCTAPAGGAPGTLELLPKETAELTLTAAVAVDAACRQTHRAIVAPPPGVADRSQGDDDVTTVVDLALCPPPAAVKIVAPLVVEEGELVEYVVTLTNPSAVPLLDAPGDEWVDTLPAETMPLDISADSGVAVLDGQTARWNGGLPADDSVEVRVSAVAKEGNAGATVCNQGTLAADGDRDGVVDLVLPTDDPGPPGPADLTCFEIELPDDPPIGVPPFSIPALGGAGRALLAALLAAAAALALRRRG